MQDSTGTVTNYFSGRLCFPVKGE